MLTYKEMLEAVVEAALDQPQPTKPLARRLNEALRVLNHPLALPYGA